MSDTSGLENTVKKTEVSLDKIQKEHVAFNASVSVLKRSSDLTVSQFGYLSLSMREIAIRSPEKFRGFVKEYLKYAERTYINFSVEERNGIGLRDLAILACVADLHTDELSPTRGAGTLFEDYSDVACYGPTMTAFSKVLKAEGKQLLQIIGERTANYYLVN